MYVYALAGAPLTRFRVSGRVLHTLPVHGIHAVVDAGQPDAGVSEAALRRQHRIVKAIASRCDAVLPVRFGALVDESELRRLLAGRRDVILQALELVRGREQMTVRLMITPPGGAGVPATGTAYLEQRRRASTLPAADLQRLQEAVGGLVHAERVHAGRSRFPATVCHLITRGRAPEYRRRLKAAGADVPTRVSGPWPAFAFGPELFE